MTEVGPLGILISNVRILPSTPPVAMTPFLYLFQSCVRHSDGGNAFRFDPIAFIPVCGAACIGIDDTRWFDAEAGLRRSNMRRWESEETDESTEGE